MGRVSPARKEEILEVDGHEVRVSSPDKVVFPEPGLTKLDIVRYYLAVAEGALRGAGGRPMVLKRFVKGIDQEAFFQKRVPENHPDFIDTATLHYARGTSAEEAVIRDAAGLAWVVNLGCLDLNPHPVRAEDLDHPDELRVDLDPMPGVDWSQIVDVAMVAREVLDDVGLVGWPKTSGSRGLHILVRIAPQWEFDDVRLAAETLAREVENRAPGPRDGALVEGGARRERVRRLQPERQGSHRGVRLLDPAAARRPRLDAASTGTRCAPAAPRSSRCRPCSSASPRSATRTTASTTRSGTLDGLLALAEELGPGREAAARRRRRPTDAASRPCRSSRSPAPRPSPRRSIALERRGRRGIRMSSPLLHPADVLVDGMRGSSSLWYRVRVNLQHVPEAERPAQEELIADYDPWAGKVWPGRSE